MYFYFLENWEMLLYAFLFVGYIISHPVPAAAVRSEVVTIVVAPDMWTFCVCPWFCGKVPCVISGVVIISLWKRELFVSLCIHQFSKMFVLQESCHVNVYTQSTI